MFLPVKLWLVFNYAETLARLKLGFQEIMVFLGFSWFRAYLVPRYLDRTSQNALTFTIQVGASVQVAKFLSLLVYFNVLDKLNPYPHWHHLIYWPLFSLLNKPPILNCFFYIKLQLKSLCSAHIWNSWVEKGEWSADCVWGVTISLWRHGYSMGNRQTWSQAGDVGSCEEDWSRFTCISKAQGIRSPTFKLCSDG